MAPKKIALLTDSCADLAPEAAEENRIHVVPLRIRCADGEYSDGVDIHAADIYARLKRGELPKTSLPAGEDIEAMFDQIKAEGYDGCIAVMLSGGLSGTYNMTRLMAEERKDLEIKVYDSVSGSLGIGIVMLQLAEDIRAGASWRELTHKRVPQLIKNTTPFFSVDTLEDLVKGGRIGKVTAMAGTMLQIKPLITFAPDGQLQSIAKVRGRKQVMDKLVELVVKSCGEAADQITEIENLIAAGDLDAIMLWPTEGEALRSAAQTIVDAGVKLVVYDRLIEDFDGLEGQMMGDNFSIGHEMGVYLNDYFKDTDKVEYLRFVGDSSTVTSQRSGGMDDVIDAKFEQINETFVTDWSTEKAQEQMENWLNAHSNEEIEALDLIVTHDDEIVDGLMNALDAYSGTAKLNVQLITSVGGREDTMQKFENTKLDVKFVTWFFAPSFIRECVDFTAETAMGLPFSGTAVAEDGIYLIPSFSISNAGNSHYDFDQYRGSNEYAVRYSIGNF